MTSQKLLEGLLVLLKPVPSSVGSIVTEETLLEAGRHQVQFYLAGLLDKPQYGSFFDELSADYLKEVYALNKERNENILQQIRFITEVLNRSGIKPLFFKGADILLSGCYQKLGERYLGDIDLLVPETELKRAFDTLLGNGFYQPDIKSPLLHHHLPTLAHKEFVAAVELHKEPLAARCGNRLLAQELLSASTLINEDGLEYYLPNNLHKLRLAYLNHEYSALGTYLGSIDLRQCMDVLRLVLKGNAIKAEFLPVFECLSEQELGFFLFVFELFEIDIPDALVLAKSSAENRQGLYCWFYDLPLQYQRYFTILAKVRARFSLGFFGRKLKAF